MVEAPVTRMTINCLTGGISRSWQLERSGRCRVSAARDSYMVFVAEAGRFMARSLQQVVRCKLKTSHTSR
jgi:hypothetical protein